MTKTERFIKNFFIKFGVLVRKYNTSSSEDLRRIKLLKHFNIDLIFDIGANSGQYAKGIIDAGYKGEIVSFEPLSEIHKKLKKASRSFDNWIVSERCAIGASKEEIYINVSQNSVSSTLMNMLDSHLDGAPDSKIIGKELVNVLPLDAVAPKYNNGSKKMFLKIDVQGFEREVLKGAETALSLAKGLEIEISLVPLYEGQNWLLPQVLEFMSQHGFRLMSIAPAFTDNQTGKMLQCNGIFFKENEK